MIRRLSPSTESIRNGIPVSVKVVDAAGRTVHESAGAEAASTSGCHANEEHSREEMETLDAACRGDRRGAVRCAHHSLRLLVLLVVASATAVVVLGQRTCRTFTLLVSAYEVGLPEASGVRRSGLAAARSPH